MATYYRYWFYFNCTRWFFLLNNPFGPYEGYICMQTTNERRVIYSRNYNQQLVSPGYDNSCSKQGLTYAVSLPVEFLGASRTYVARIYIFTITVSAQNVSADWVYVKKKRFPQGSLGVGPSNAMSYEIVYKWLQQMYNYINLSYYSKSLSLLLVT